MYRIDFSKYAQGIPQLGAVDAGAGFRALAQQNLEQQRMAENTRQFNTNSEMRQKEHQDLVQHQNQQEHDINARFATEQGQGLEMARHKEEEAKQVEHEKTVQLARDMVVHGKWNEAMGLIGKLKEQGADVSVEQGTDGTPTFNLRGKQSTVKPINGDYNSIMQQMGNGEAHNPTEINGHPTTPMATPGEYDNVQNPAETSLGTTAAAASGANPNHPGPVEGVSSSQPSNATANASGSGDSADAGVQPTQDHSNAINPYELNTGTLQSWTNKRLDPMLSGIEGGIPSRFQGQGHSYLQGLKSLGQTPEDTLDTMQKPLDTLAGLWKGEMSADAAMARASMSQGGQESNRDIRLEDRTWRRTQDIDKQWDLSANNKKYIDVDNIDRMLQENNPMADAQILHKIRGLFQTGVATQKDIDAVKEGVGKGFVQELADATNEKILGSGLNPDSRAGLRRFMGAIKQSSQSNIINAREQLNNLLQNVSTREEAVSALQYMNSHIPRNLWTPEMVKIQKELSGDFSDKQPTGHPMVGGKKSASASASTKSGKPVSATVSEDENDVAERLLNGD